MLPQNKVAVTLPNKQEILFLEMSGQISTINSIAVNRFCFGITYHQDLLYMVCQYPNSVLVLDMKGTIKQDIALKRALNETFRNPTRIKISIDGKTMYVSDWGDNFVARITLKVKVTGVYKNDNMKDPLGLVVLQDGSLLVCCGESGTIHRVSSDLKYGHTLTKGVTEARSICYQPDNQKIFVGSDGCDCVKVFKLN